MNLSHVMTRRKVLGGLVVVPSMLMAADPGAVDDRDRQVLEAVLLAMLANPDFGSPKRQQADATVVLHHRTPEKTGMLAAGQLKADTKGHTFAPALGDALRARNVLPHTFDCRAASFKGLAFNARIEVANTHVPATEAHPWDAFEATYPKARGWVEAWLPGFSADGSQALVRGWFGPWPHSATVTALVTRRGDQWKVQWHQLTFYA